MFCQFSFGAPRKARLWRYMQQQHCNKVKVLARDDLIRRVAQGNGFLGPEKSRIPIQESSTRNLQ